MVLSHFISLWSLGLYLLFLAKLRITLLELKIDGYAPRHPHVQLRLGHRVLLTPKRAADYRWNDTFEFEVSFHQHLFWTVQVNSSSASGKRMSHLCLD